MMDERRAKVLAEAMTWKGTPYHHRENHKGVGVDCLYLLLECFRPFGFVPPDYNPGPYSRTWFNQRSEQLYLAGVAKFAKRLPEGVAPQPADVALFWVGRCVAHGAIIVDEERLIHARARARCVEIALRREPELVASLHSYWSPFDA